MKLSVAELFKEAFLWIANDDGTFEAQYAGSNNIKQSQQVTSTELREVHYQLPEAMRAISDHKKSLNESGIIPAHRLRDTLAVLHNSHVTLTDTRDRTCQYSAITSMVEETSFQDIYYLTGFLIDVEYDDNVHPTVPFVSASCSTTFHVTKDELEKRFPGFEHRLTFGKELGLSGTALLQTLFTKPLTNEKLVTIDNVTFE